MNEELKYIRICEKFAPSFTDIVGGVAFEAGVSVEPQNELVCNRMAAIWHVELYTEMGEARETIVSAMSKTATRNLLADAAAEKIAAEKGVIADARAATAAIVIDAADEVLQLTREQLEEIADEKGIAGVREIATKLGVTSKSISELINKILEQVNAQNSGKREEPAGVDSIKAVDSIETVETVESVELLESVEFVKPSESTESE